MRKTSLLLFIAGLSALAQESRTLLMSSLSGTLASGIQFRFKVMAVPPRGDLAGRTDVSGVMVSDPENVVHRFVVDAVHRQYFGYDISAQATSVAGQNRVTIAPLTIDPKDLPEQFQGFSKGALTPVLLPKHPDSQIVSESDTIELDLLVSLDGKQKVVDYIQVATKPEPPAAKNNQQPNDYTLDDGPINFDFDSDTSVWVNGEKYSGSTWSETRPGATV